MGGIFVRVFFFFCNSSSGNREERWYYVGVLFVVDNPWLTDALWKASSESTHTKHQVVNS